ncbi:hypothetical protein HO173_011230 [Letharia columbiana]|uniref:Probable glucan endo-1,3-beta-glucosidase eglC n=1 Tax=Letharia columbiana TaxID=112416 RepID=A0A8H6KZC6_9LECA|nr:uncharacterized protein HO173_011230 [Letharia columbiana]KAF6229800.1 hypothetical protein HO173_011230 [Letharia columbiana]
MLSSTLLAAFAACFSLSQSAFQGFNYGSTNTDSSPVTLEQFTSDFTTAKALVGTNDAFTSARLYTCIQAGTTNTPSDAFQAAVNTNTSLLLGLWASAGQENINNEIAALTTFLQGSNGAALATLIVGISVGSEDLYRISPTGIINMSGVGASPDDISNYIGQVKTAIASTAAKNALVGHVDTWTAWVNGSNDAVITSSDFIGMDAYPYFQNTMTNPIGDGYSLFDAAYEATISAAGGKPVWVTETGWPVSGATSGDAVPSVANAQTYWDQVGCGLLFGKTNTWWFTLQDAYPTTPNPSFGIVGTTLSDTPLYDLSCSSASTSASSIPAAQATATAGALSINAAGAGNEGTPSTAGEKASSAGSSPAETVSSSASSPAAAVAPVTTSSSVAQPEMASTPAPETPSPTGPAPTTLITKTSVLPAASASGASASGCPASLSGTHEFPHLIVPVNKDLPTTAGGTSYNGTFSSTVSSIFNFDIPESDSGKKCSLVFLLPTQDELISSAFSFSGTGSLDFAQLQSPATEQTSYSTVPAVESDLGGPTSVTPGNEYVIASGSCAAGTRVSYEVSSTGSLALNYFQDSNAAAIGFYITVC